MNAKIRILSFLMAAVMIFGCLPMTAFATGVNAVAECTHADENKDCLCDTCSETYHPNVNGQCTSCGIWNFETSRIESNETTDVYNVTQSDKGNATGVVVSELDYIDDSTVRPQKYASYLSIASDPVDSSNKVLKVDNVTIGSSYNSLFTVTPYVENEEGNVYVLEYSVYVQSHNNNNSTPLRNYIESDPVDSDATRKYSTAIYYIKANNVKYFRLGNSADTKANLTIGQWLRTRFVYDKAAGKYYSYFSFDNGLSWIYANQNTYSGAVDQMGLQFLPYNTTGVLYIDDMLVYKTDDAATVMFGGENLKKQLASAKSGETVKLFCDVNYSGGYINVPAGVTLDLNGYDLTAEGISLFNGASIIDGQATKGLLKVPQGNFATANATYKMLPIWNGEGYILTDVTPDGHLYTAETLDTLGENQIKAYFRPQFGDSAVTDFVNLLSDGAANNGLSWTVEIDCLKGDAVAQTISFAVPDASIGNIYTDYLQDNPPYITLTVGGAGSNFDSYSVRLVIESDCGITYSKVIGTYTPAVAE